MNTKPLTETSLTALELQRIARDLRSDDIEVISDARSYLLTCIDTLDDTHLANLIDMTVIDHKTFLGNTMLLEESVAEILQSDDVEALFMTTDLVNFKKINDEFGHKVGDEVIKLTATALLAAIRVRPRLGIHDSIVVSPADVIGSSSGYRIGGDENAAILRDGTRMRDLDHNALVRNKIVTMLGYTGLQDYLKDLEVKNFAIRASFVLIDRTKHTSYEEVLGEADPKQNSKCEYALNRQPDGTFAIGQVK